MGGKDIATHTSIRHTNQSTKMPYTKQYCETKRAEVYEARELLYAKFWQMIRDIQEGVNGPEGKAALQQQIGPQRDEICRHTDLERLWVRRMRAATH